MNDIEYIDIIPKQTFFSFIKTEDKGRVLFSNYFQLIYQIKGKTYSYNYKKYDNARYVFNLLTEEGSQS